MVELKVERQLYGFDDLLFLYTLYFSKWRFVVYYKVMCDCTVLYWYVKHMVWELYNKYITVYWYVIIFYIIKTKQKEKLSNVSFPFTLKSTPVIFIKTYKALQNHFICCVMCGFVLYEESRSVLYLWNTLKLVTSTCDD